MEWLTNHWVEVLGVTLLVLPAVITGLTPYPEAKGVVTALRVVLDVLSVVTHKNSPNSLKLPLVQRSTKPEDGGAE